MKTQSPIQADVATAKKPGMSAKRVVSTTATTAPIAVPRMRKIALETTMPASGCDTMKTVMTEVEACGSGIASAT